MGTHTDSLRTRNRQGAFARSRFKFIASCALAAALTGCASWWNLGPEPDNFVGKDGSEKLLTDPGLHAVTPQVRGDEPGGGVTFPNQIGPASAPATTTSASAATPIPEALSVQEAVLSGLEHNISLRIQRVNVPRARTSEELALSAFDPTVSGAIQGGRTGSARGPTDAISANATVTEFLPTGTTIEAGVTTSNNFYSESALSTGANLTVTQSLLRGYGLDVNLASLREAELATKVTQYQLRGVAESLVASIEIAYWNLALAEMQVQILQDAVDVSQKQLDDTRTRIQVQRLSPSEQPAAEAEIASRREALIDAQSALETQRLRFFQLLSPADRAFWDRKVRLTTLPFIPAGTMDPVDSHVDVAMRYRPDLNEAVLELQRGDLEVVRSKNGLLPRLDLFVTLGKTGFSSSFGDSVAKGFDSPDYQAVLGVKGDWEPINRAAKASYRAAELSKDQLQDTLDNQRQLAQLDVRVQYIEVERTRKQIDATRVTREAAQATVDVQKGKFDAGNGTSLDLSIASQALLVDELSEVQAVTNHLIALVNLYQLEGTLLLRRGIAAPGAAPVGGPAPK